MRQDVPEYLHDHLYEEYIQYTNEWLEDANTIGEPLSFAEWLEQYENA